VLCAVLLMSGAAAASSPDWLRAAMQTPTPAYPEKTAAVVLLHEEITTVSDSGEVKTLYRRAVKILRASGRDYGTAAVYFDSETKLSNFRAWSITAQGREYEVKDKEAVETSAFDGGTLYGDTRIKMIRLPALEPGTVVGWEYEQKQRPHVLQDMWQVQESIPVLKSDYVLSLPPGWEVSTKWLNMADQPPTVAGNQYTWQVANVPAIEDENVMPAFRSLAARMAVNYFPSGGTSRDMSKWQQVANFEWQLAADRAQVTPAIAQQTAQLIAGKATELDKVRAIANFMQRDIRYVAIEIGIGGYQPHAAGDVFVNRYGDCKDKATLMSAMLRSAGIDSYLVLTQSERGVIAKQFPTPAAFNHMIIAIRLKQTPEVAALPALVEHPGTDNLLIFDPTDSTTPLGQLPIYLQGNMGLLVSEKDGSLLRLPFPKPDENSIKRSAKLALDSAGHLSGEVTEVRTGTEATLYRDELVALTPEKRMKFLENYLNNFLTGFSVKSFDVEHLTDYDRDLIIHYTFDSSSYGKSMGSMFLVRPRVFGSKVTTIVDLKKRLYPVELDTTTLQTDDFDISLPPGFQADDLPPVTDVKSSIGSYRSETTFKENTLHYSRKYEITGVRVPLDNLRDFNTFNAQIDLDERNSALFKKPH